MYMCTYKMIQRENLFQIECFAKCPTILESCYFYNIFLIYISKFPRYILYQISELYFIKRLNHCRNVHKYIFT